MGSEHIADRPIQKPVQSRVTRFTGSKWSLVSDTVALDDQRSVKRDVVIHPGAVGIVAVDAEENVYVLRQYRHPVAAELWEIPAGLLDDPGETPWATAQRELVEEAGLRADEWHTIVDLYSSPGMSSEVVRVYLARGLSEVPLDERPPLSDEELDMVVKRVPLDVLIEKLLNGNIHNSLAVAGIFATAEARKRQWQGLLPPDHPWPKPTWLLR
jgi:ADP-ribose pyrophosphatase